MEPHPELVRLVSLLESYDAALAELEAWNDPGVERLAAELDTLRARAALDVASRYPVEDADRARADS